MAERVDVLPDYAVGDVVSAIRVLIRFGGIAEAEADHTRLAEASRRLVRSRWWAEVSQDTMLAALPELIAEAHRIEADDAGE